jgi:hypothetical protein
MKLNLCKMNDFLKSNVEINLSRALLYQSEPCLVQPSRVKPNQTLGTLYLCLSMESKFTLSYAYLTKTNLT